MANTQLTSIQIAKDPILAESIESLIYDMAVRAGVFVPINNRSYKYKNYMVINGPNGSWNVFLMPRKVHIATTFLKVSAFAACKLHENEKLLSLEQLLKNDAVFEKNYIDSVHYKKTYNITQDSVRKDTAEWRWEISLLKAKIAKAKIDRLFKMLTA